jgi:hypothetical protein
MKHGGNYQVWWCEQEYGSQNAHRVVVGITVDRRPQVAGSPQLDAVVSRQSPVASRLSQYVFMALLEVGTYYYR